MQQNSKMAIAISILMIVSITASIVTVSAQVYPQPGTHVASYAQINVAPNPIGIGQTVTVNMYLAVPLETSENPYNMTLYITDPSGNKQTLGPFTGDVTGGTYYAFAPDKLGNYSIYWYYPGQTLTGSNANSARPGWGDLIQDSSTSPTITLTVQEEPVTRSAYPITPLPTTWWETPVTAQNIQNWYKITGPWLGLSSNPFASTGTFDTSSVCNPSTQSVTSGHVLWTLPWGAGGVPGGEILGGTESSNFWMTRQYSPNFAPVIMNGVLYSDLYTFGKSSGADQGIVAVNMFTGERLFTINTTNSLRCGSMAQFKNPNQYGVVGPFLWTTGNLPASDTGGVDIRATYHTSGTQWNMYDAFDGKYIGSIVNGTSATLSIDDQGGLVGYYINNTAGTQIVRPGTGSSSGSTANRVSVEPYPVTNTGPHLDCFNFTTANIGAQPNRNFVIDWSRGIQFAAPIAQSVSGVPIASGGTSRLSLSINTVTQGVVALTAGFIHGQGVGGEQAGWLIVSGMDGVDGHQLMLKNITSADTAVMEPWTRLSYNWGQGDAFIFDGFNWKGVSYDMRTGDKQWEMQLTPTPGYEINPYDVFNFKTMYANGQVIAMGFGGDMWGVNATTGQQIWAQNTLNVMGDPGVETPYGTWPLWVFAAQCQSSDVAYFGVGHEYNPPLFHGAQLLAINMTDGSLVWKELGTYTRAMAIADGILISVNEYDNQVYAFGKGPSATTVSAPSVGVSTATPITITGTVMDVSPGSEQDAVYRNYAYGLPAVSDESQSAFMETVYQQQPMPYNITGVVVTLSVIDANGNFRNIGTTTTNAAGSYGYTWTPDISGDFNLIASFSGSNSYYGSSAQTYFHAGEPATHEPTQPPQQQVDNTMTIIGATVAIIIAIAIVGLLTVRKRP